MTNYTPDNSHVGFRKERSFRCGGCSNATGDAAVAGTQASPVALGVTQVLRWDHNEADMEIPKPWRTREEFRDFGNGQNVGYIVEKGFEATEKDLEMKMQSAIALYYILGGCSSSGTVIPGAADTVASGFGTTTVVLTNAGTYAKNALAGFSVTITGATTVVTRVVSHAATSASALTLVLAAAAPATGGADALQWMGADLGTDVIFSGQNTITCTLTNTNTVAVNALVGKTIITSEVTALADRTYIIVANTAVTGAACVLTLNKRLGSAADATTATFYTYPYTHTISEANTIPSMIVHIEQMLTAGSTTQAAIDDLLGVLFKKVVISIEKGGVVKLTASVIISKSIDGNIQTTFPSALTEEIYTWDMVARTGTDAFYFTYNSTAVEGTNAFDFLNEADKIEITIERPDLEISQVFGDEYPFKVKYGKRDYSISCHYTPTNAVLEALRNTKLKDYTGNLAFRVSLNALDDDSQYTMITFSSLYLAEYPNQLAQYETKQVGVDFVLKNAPAVGSITAGTCAVSALDHLDKRYFEEDIANVTW